ncbi:hypothetical protein Sjap_007463 [Stephania japonica]|uniref:3-beta hydroxysteroid dehydrogenase/isomerase domain-containing protein n=1 Tax=Stephania japonica TaxID=461633 RepID=A0AAP0PBC6_9MAGN
MGDDDEKETVCVTGAGGYLSVMASEATSPSWLQGPWNCQRPSTFEKWKLIISGDDGKNGHLKKLENAVENLQLFKADMLDFESLCEAIDGCTGVFHTACPVPYSSALQDPEIEMIGPAVEGTCNVLKACSKAKVKRVVMVSSVAAVFMKPNLTKDQILDETCWSDTEYCMTNDELEEFPWHKCYSYAKTEAEIRAFEYAKENGLDLVTVCPTLIIGPLLRPAMNIASALLLSFARDGVEKVNNNVDFMVVDVRDVAEALLLVYEKPEANGRYICAAYPGSFLVLVNKMKTFYPSLNYPKQISEQGFARKLSSEKLIRLGWKYRALEESIVDSIEDFFEKGLLDRKA